MKKHVYLNQSGWAEPTEHDLQYAADCVGDDWAVVRVSHPGQPQPQAWVDANRPVMIFHTAENSPVGILRRSVQKCLALDEAAQKKEEARAVGVTEEMIDAAMKAAITPLTPAPGFLDDKEWREQYRVILAAGLAAKR